MPSLSTAKRVVIKLGTGILTEGIGQLHRNRIAALAREIATYCRQGLEVIIVSSGAVGLGMGRLGLKKKPTRLATLQKCAAVGQSQLIETWQQCFNPYELIVGQLLLTRDNVVSRERHVAAKALLEELLSSGIIPIINENDSISADELKFGDNDLLSAMVASMTKADMLIILSTAPGLIHMQGDQQIIPVVEKVTAEIESLAQGPTDITATGGMVTKLQAARMATYSGCAVFIASGAQPNILGAIYRGDATGTLFQPAANPMVSRKSWIAFFHQPTGAIEVDAGAAMALQQQGGSLLATGITAVKGPFQAGDVVAIARPNHPPFGHGIADFGSTDLESIIGLESDKIRAKFPHRKNVDVVHRDALVMLD